MHSRVTVLIGDSGLALLSVSRSTLLQYAGLWTGGDERIRDTARGYGDNEA